MYASFGELMPPSFPAVVTNARAMLSFGQPRPKAETHFLNWSTVTVAANNQE
jgi:hypothetical protein